MKRRLIVCSLLSLALAGPGLAQDEKKPAAPAGEDKVKVALETSMGRIVLELDGAKAPATVANFKKYVEKGYYDGTIFHRVINDFMIQGGGFEQKDDTAVQKETEAPVKNEAKNGLKNLRGTIAMARTSDPHSATSQFFINVKDNNSLNPGGFGEGSAGYAVFGKVVEGMDVVDKIKAVETGTKMLTARLPNGQTRKQPMQNVPTEDVVIKSAKILGGEAKDTE